MMLSKRRVLVGAVLIAAFAIAGLAASRVTELEKSLEQTRRSLTDARKKASEVDKEMFRFKDRVVYNDPSLKEIYLEMKALEKELLAQREKLDNEIMKLPEYREILKRRNDAYAAVRGLADEEEFIITQLKTARIQESEE